MVFRTWRAVALDADAASAYAEHLRARVLPALQAIDGHAGAYLLTARTDDGVDILVITRWRSMDSIRQFAGENVDRAVVEPEARAVLTRFDDRVIHYDVVIDTTSI